MLLPSLVRQRVVRRWIDGVLADLDGRTGPPSTKTMEQKLVRKALFQRFKAQVSASTARSSKKRCTVRTNQDTDESSNMM
jgi:hypothetical protein